MEEKGVKIIHKYRAPTKQTRALKGALEKEGVHVLLELHDGYKHIDLAIPNAKINVEVDGMQHLTDPHQIVSDLARGYYSHKNGYDTLHIPNKMIDDHLGIVARALAEASRTRAKRIHVHME